MNLFECTKKIKFLTFLKRMIWLPANLSRARVWCWIRSELTQQSLWEVSWERLDPCRNVGNSQMSLPWRPFMCVYLFIYFFLQISLMRYSMMFHDVCRFKIWFYRNFCLRSGGSGRYTPTPAEVGMIRFSLYFFFTFFGQFTNKKAILKWLLSKVRGLFLILLTVFLPWDFCCNHPAEELARRLFVVLDHIQIWAPGITRVATFFFPDIFLHLLHFFAFVCYLRTSFSLEDVGVLEGLRTFTVPSLQYVPPNLGRSMIQARRSS